LTSKLAGAAPLGTFQEGQGGLFHLFERAGRAVIIASVGQNSGSAPVALRVGSAGVTLTDYQGNETALRAHDGVVELPRASLPYFVEGADLDAIKAAVVAEIAGASTGSGAGAGNVRAGSILPRVAVVRGAAGRLAVRLHNPYGQRLSGTVALEVPPGWPAPGPIAFALAPAGTRLDEVKA